jgi:hypothetical protein
MKSLSAGKGKSMIWRICAAGLLMLLLGGMIFPAASLGSEHGTRDPAVSDKGIEALIMLLKQKGIISEDEARTFLERLYESAAGLPQQTEDQTGKTEQASEALEQQVEENRKSMEENVDDLMQRDRLAERRIDQLEKKVLEEVAGKQYKASWAERVELGGDLRLRYQNEMKDETNDDRLGSEGIEPTNIDRQRWRYRARLGLKAKLIDPRETNVGKAEVGFRLATGNANDPVSTNQTLGDHFNKDDIFFDRAYLKWSWTPTEQIWGDKLPQVLLIGGRMANPFFSTDLVWDSDVNFEGATLKLVSDTFEGNSWRTFFTAGAYPLDEYEFREDSKWLFGSQVGLEHKPFWGLNYKLAVAYYDFNGVKGDPITALPETGDIDFDWGQPSAVQGGNTLVNLNRVNIAPLTDPIYGLAADFRELNVTAMVDIDRFFPIHVILWADYVKNIGSDKDEIRKIYSASEVPDYELDQTEGYQVGLTLGYPKVREAGQWSIAFSYKHLEANAVLDAFTDSDFNTGGTDAEGFGLKVEIGLYKNIWLATRYLSTNEIIEERGQFAVDTLQMDINAEF